MARALDQRRKQLKEQFTRARGYWNALWDDILYLSPEFFEAYMHFSSVPWKSGVLEPKVREFIYISIDAATTHQHDQGLHVHSGNALRYGATKEELLEVLQLACIAGMHTLTMGVPVLLDEMRKAGRPASFDNTLSEQQEAMKQDFTAKLGYWSELWDATLRASPECFESAKNLAAVPWQYGVLKPKIRELIYIAIDSSTTQLYEPALREHIRNALRYGASMEEIMEVFELASVLGIHAYTLGVPVVVDELKKARIPLDAQAPRRMASAEKSVKHGAKAAPRSGKRGAVRE